ncbi:MAG: type II toxin-antitoxin system YafQ family toxin [Prevotella sp.]|nr:type II toxin-antitoxin system YafQ family toxin [Prevotella sp.]MDE6688359.1 type II toxin-antitoxin system YafQ family toxin [Prevotella sp.]MDE6808423.1 type II toxin-antitoxin system YafQ family toxin [Prevotella sp.]MDE7088590.1 type II toxin-antitoxin system YafQ family toxin [Prevotella sp.]
MKYSIKVTNAFKRSFKRCLKRGLDESVLSNALSVLAETGCMPPEYKPHPLTGNYKGCMECHLQPDWLLIWKQNDRELILILVDTGTHSDLFK